MSERRRQHTTGVVVPREQCIVPCKLNAHGLRKKMILKFKKPTHLVGPGHLCIHFYVATKGRPSRATSP